MPSPFPGMNPYFEQARFWRGFHTEFLVHLRGALTPLVVPRYFVALEESIYLEHPDDSPRPFAVADVAVSEEPHPPPAGPAVSPADAPVTATIPASRPLRRKRRWLAIRDASERTVVTVIEMLSPSDKRSGKDRDRYLEKRNRVLGSRTHLIEIDLLRGGQRMPIDQLPVCDYYLMVARRPERPQVKVWPFRVRDPFHPLYVPLRPGEPELVIDLKPVLDQTYDGGGYGYQIYRHPPEPPLAAADADWARQFLPPG